MIEELRQHYAQAIGAEPILHEMNTRSGKRMGVFEWPAGTTRLGVHLYASAGAGHYWKDHHGHAVELFAGVKQGGQDVLEAFCTMALNVRESGTVPQHGVFVAGDWKIIKGRKFTGWVLTERPDDFMPQLDLPGGHVVFLDALPVFPEEAEYRHGDRSDDLFDIWEAEGRQVLGPRAGTSGRYHPMPFGCRQVVEKCAEQPQEILKSLGGYDQRRCYDSAASQSLAIGCAVIPGCGRHC